MVQVLNSATGDRLQGTASEELVRRSTAAWPTGAVAAYRDEAGVWQYLAESAVDHYRRHLGVEVLTVWVEGVQRIVLLNEEVKSDDPTLSLPRSLGLRPDGSVEAQWVDHESEWYSSLDDFLATYRLAGCEVRSFEQGDFLVQESSS